MGDKVTIECPSCNENIRVSMHFVPDETKRDVCSSYKNYEAGMGSG